MANFILLGVNLHQVISFNQRIIASSGSIATCCVGGRTTLTYWYRAEVLKQVGLFFMAEF